MRWTINALLKRTDRQRGEARRSSGKRDDGEGDADEGAGKKVKRGEKRRQLSNSIKIPARMLPAPKLKAAADEDEDEDVAQSDRLRDEPAETETELLSSCTTPPPPLLLHCYFAGKRKAATPSPTAAHVGSFCTH